MSHYEERLQADLDEIRERVKAVGDEVIDAVGNACRSLLNVDRALAAETILGDLPVNREIRAIDQRCHAFVVRHLPSAGILRFVSSVLRLTVAIERIGELGGGPRADEMRRAFEKALERFQAGESG